MSEHAVAWSVILGLSVVGIVGLFHTGINLGGDLGGAVQSIVRFFGTSL